MKAAFTCSPATTLRRGRPKSYFSDPITCSSQPSPQRPPATPSPSALDELPQSLKLNAVAAAVAQKNDHKATLDLLNEMNTLNIPLDKPTQTTILNASITHHKHLSSLLSLLHPPGYNSITLPSPLSSHTTETLKIDPNKPLDMSVATIFLTLISTSLSVEFIEPTLLHHSPDEATAVLFSIGILLVTDRYILSKSVWNVIQRGLLRLLSRNDIERVARTDAANFLIAYLLGLPWLCYRPDGKRAARWVHSNNNINKCLTWLVAAVAMELQYDSTLIISDLGKARQFMTIIRKDKKQNLTIKESDQRIHLAVLSAMDLLTQYRDLHVALTDTILAGSSVGECVALVADNFSHSET